VPRITDRIEGIYLRVLRRRQRLSGLHDRQPVARPPEQG